jgi:hypothetical protein
VTECKCGIFSYHIISVEKVHVSSELFMINYFSKYVKENTLSNVFTSKICLFQKMFIDS